MEDGGGVCQAILRGLSRDGLGELWRVSFHLHRSSSCTIHISPAKPSFSKTKASKTSEVAGEKLTNTSGSRPNHVQRPARGGGGSVQVVSSGGNEKEVRALARLRCKHLSWRFCPSRKNKHCVDLQQHLLFQRGMPLCTQACGLSARGSATPL